MQTVATRIAQDFAARLHAELGPQVITEINRRNATAAYQSGACATHEYCDANVSMAEAFEAVIGRAPEPASEDDAKLWNTAWDAARAAGFAPEYLGGPSAA